MTQTAEHARDLSATKQVEALGNWQALLAGFGMKELTPSNVIDQLWNMSKSHRRAFQLGLKGAGHVTERFIPDGEMGTETSTSIDMLFKAAGEPY